MRTMEILYKARIGRNDATEGLRAAREALAVAKRQNISNGILNELEKARGAANRAATGAAQARMAVKEAVQQHSNPDEVRDARLAAEEARLAINEVGAVVDQIDTMYRVMKRQEETRRSKPPRAPRPT